MKTLLVISIALAAAASCLAGDNDKPVRRIRIFHADPQLIMMLLGNGHAIQPEYSTLVSGFSNGFGGGSGPNSGQGIGGSHTPSFPGMSGSSGSGRPGK